eukprot:4646231-Amphidinium_carterae.1
MHCYGQQSELAARTYAKVGRQVVYRFDTPSHSWVAGPGHTASIHADTSRTDTQRYPKSLQATYHT